MEMAKMRRICQGTWESARQCQVQGLLSRTSGRTQRYAPLKTVGLPYGRISRFGMGHER